MGKKVNTGKLIDNNMVITTLLIVAMFVMYLVKQGYVSINAHQMTRNITWVICIFAFLLSIVFLVFGFKRKNIYFDFSAWFAGLAILTMLMKINFEIKALQIVIPGFRTFKFLYIVIALSLIYIVISWIYIVYKVITKK